MDPAEKWVFEAGLTLTKLVSTLETRQAKLEFPMDQEIFARRALKDELLSRGFVTSINNEIRASSLMKGESHENF